MPGDREELDPLGKGQDTHLEREARKSCLGAERLIGV